MISFVTPIVYYMYSILLHASAMFWIAGFTIIVKASPQVSITESFKYITLEFYCEGVNRKPVYLSVRAMDYNQFRTQFPNKFAEYTRVNSIPENSSHPCKFIYKL